MGYRIGSVRFESVRLGSIPLFSPTRFSSFRFDSVVRLGSVRFGFDFVFFVCSVPSFVVGLLFFCCNFVLSRPLSRPPRPGANADQRVDHCLHQHEVLLLRSHRPGGLSFFQRVMTGLVHMLRAVPLVCCALAGVGVGRGRLKESRIRR